MSDSETTLTHMTRPDKDPWRWKVQGSKVRRSRDKGEEQGKILGLGKVVGVGIDVSKDSLAVCLVYERGKEENSYSNDGGGIAELLERMKHSEGGLKGYKVVMESTGRYHFLTAFELSQAGLDVRVVNPLLAKPYAQSRIRKVKTDKVDAQGLAEMAIKEQKLPKAFSSNKRAILIRQKMGLLASLEKQLQSLQAIFNGYFEFQGVMGFESSPIEQQMLGLVKSLGKQSDQLEQEINTLILEQPQNSKPQQCLDAIPGVSPSLAALLVQFLDTDCQHPKQWIAFLGLDLSIHQSGRWVGKGKLSKRGSPYLRKRLYSAAWGASMNYPEFKNYYLQLKRQAHSHVEALLIIARKLLRIAFTCLKSNQTYDPKLAFPNFSSAQTPSTS